MAGRSDGLAIKALFSLSKGDPPPQKKKNKSASPKNAPPPDQKEKSPSPHQNQSGKLPSPNKNAPSPGHNANSPTDQNMKSTPKEINSPPSLDKKENESENIWKAPPKLQVDIDDLLQRARAISSQVQEHGLIFNLEEVRQDQKKRTVLCLCHGQTIP